MDRSNDHRRTVGRQKVSPETVFWIFLVVVLTLGGAGFWLYSNLNGSTEPVDIIEDVTEPVDTEEDVTVPVDIEEDVTVPLDIEEPEDSDWLPEVPDTHTSILLLGLDSHGLSDVIMIISYDMATYDSSLISIKRDTFISEQTWADKNSGLDHLTFANYFGMGPEKDYHAGARLATQTIEDLLGIELHAYASITFEGFVDLVDLIGGVVVDVAPAFAEREGGALPTGHQLLMGEQALIYARHRQNPRIPEPGSTSQDGDRVRRNQNLLKAILEQCKTLESDELLAVVDQLENKLYTSLDDWAILELANILYNRDTSTIKSVVLPGEGKMVYQTRTENDVYYYFLDFAESNIILQELGLK